MINLKKYTDTSDNIYNGGLLFYRVETSQLKTGVSVISQYINLDKCL